MKTTPTLILCTIFLVTLAACANTGSAQPSVPPNPQETNIPTPTPENGNEVNMNQILFDLSLENLEAGRTTVTADYLRSEIKGTTFLLNRDFEVTRILCDGQDISIDEIVGTVNIYDYEVKQ